MEPHQQIYKEQWLNSAYDYDHDEREGLHDAFKELGQNQINNMDLTIELVMLHVRTSNGAANVTCKD